MMLGGHLLLCHVCKRHAAAANKLHSIRYHTLTSALQSILLPTSSMQQNQQLIHNRQRPQTKVTKKPVDPGVSRVMFAKFYAKRDELAEKIEEFKMTHLTAASLVDRTPNSVQPYLRLIRADKPIGTLLLYFPCAYSICLATPYGQLPSFYYLGKKIY